MSWLSSALGLNKTPHTSVDGQITSATNTSGQNATQDRNQYLDIMGGGQDALNTSVSSAMSAAMPQFNQEMQQTRENDVRRGISTGDLGTSFEGDLASSFQRNIANAAGSQAMNLFNSRLGAASGMAQNDNNTYLSMLRGNQDYQMAQQNAKRQKSAGLFGGLGALGGAAIGGALGGPLGASVGSSVGGSLGSGLGG
jgi:hypothetical protein